MEENLNLTPEEIEKIKQIYEEEEKQLAQSLENGPISYQPFPFDQLERIDLSQLPLFEHTLKVFSLVLKSELFRIGLDISKVSKGKTNLIKYKHFAEHLEGDYYFVIFKTQPLPSYGVLAFRTKFLFSLVSLLLGGEPEELKIEKNVITQTEYKILEKFFNTILRTFEQEFSKLYKVKMEITDTDTDKSLAKANITDKKVLITNFSISFASGEEEIFYLIIDEETIEPVVHVFMGSKEEEEDYKKVIWKAIRTTEVPISVILHATPRKLENILDWKKGDLILLEEFANKPVKGYIENNPVMEGYLGKHQGFYALLFLKWFKE